METTEPCTFEIATGREAKPGKNGWVEIKVNADTRMEPREKEDGRVDYREINTIPIAERGQVIAIVHPPVPGQSGCTVTNEPLPAKQTVPVELKLGKGIEMSDDKIICTEPGRPHIEKRGQLIKVSILHKLTHKGNVDLAFGNIRFMGDVEIIGNVGESMLVEASGDISVHKEVNRASLTASGSITTYGNIVGSELSAGENNILIAELGQLIGTMHQETEKMIVVISQLVNSPAFKNHDFSKEGLQLLIRILLEKKFKSFAPLAKKYVDVVRKGETYLDEEWRAVAVELTKLFFTLSNEYTSIKRISELSQKMKDLDGMSKTPVESDSNIVIPSVSNSHLYCSGNVEVNG